MYTEHYLRVPNRLQLYETGRYKQWIKTWPEIYDLLVYDIIDAYQRKEKLTLYIGTDSVKTTHGRRRFCTAVGTMYGRYRKIYPKIRVQPDCMELRLRLLYEMMCSTTLTHIIRNELWTLLSEQWIALYTDIDINPNPRFGSSIAYATATRYLEVEKKKHLRACHNKFFPLNFRFKPDANFATRIWDRWCRGTL